MMDTPFLVIFCDGTKLGYVPERNQLVVNGKVSLIALLWLIDPQSPHEDFTPEDS
jgi:hypothetical protein